MAAEISCSQPEAVFAPAARAFAWPKLLAPSLSDLFFLFLTVWLFIVTPAGWARLLLDADTALHIRVGQYILSTGDVPHRDLFSFSKPGETWYAFEWLSETAFGAVFNVAAYKGVALLGGMLIALYVTVLLKYTVWKGASGLLALILTLIAATATSFHFHARPHLFTLLFLTGSIWVMEYNRRHGGLLIWSLVPLTALWVNLHGGFFMFLVILGMRAAGCAGEAWFWTVERRARRREALQLGVLFVLCSLASLINPYGFSLHRHILEVVTSPWVVANVAEFQAPSFRSEEMRYALFLLFAGLTCVTSLVRKGRLVEPLWMVFLAYCSLTSVRHIAIFVLVATPIIALEMSEYWKSLVDGRSKRSLPAVLDDLSSQLANQLRGTSLFIPLAIVALALVPWIQWPTAFPQGWVPVIFVDAHADLLAGSRLFTTDQIADYLIFKNYPRQRVFFDSRHNYYGDSLGDEYFAISNGNPTWRSLLEKYKFNVILCPANGPLASLVPLAGGWRTVDSNGKFVLFERNGKL